ncbi:MAG: hypothetical protein NTW86_09270 [Candidatus Sumerlaeota bacterium]|nr:hypothetical protein [Candidatus Sumerlaeota bacterium]
MSYLINIVAPQLVLLNGGLMAFEDLVMPEILRGARECTQSDCLARTRICASRLEHATALGAAARGLSSLCDVPGHFYV